MRYIVVFFIMAFTLNAHAFQPSIEIIEQFDDVKLVAFVSEADLENYPSWKPGKEAPPLSVSRAIELIDGHYSAQQGEAVNEIELRTIPKHGNYWHYLIKVKSAANSSIGYQVYIVLMSGKVIPAMIETESYK